ncbi:hypothetical protein [Flammeovirga sp. OC4]|uniref:hypothetical protein n=1 Tax=Flammeovirga sp. OC4 TaxID=1382345 RepID=UPI0012DFFFA0|nr:hypothetical protein [Flammeovirga sp. OC4]
MRYKVIICSFTIFWLTSCGLKTDAEFGRINSAYEYFPIDLDTMKSYRHLINIVEERSCEDISSTLILRTDTINYKLHLNNFCVSEVCSYIKRRNTLHLKNDSIHKILFKRTLSYHQDQLKEVLEMEINNKNKQNELAEDISKLILFYAQDDSSLSITKSKLIHLMNVYSRVEDDSTSLNVFLQ